MTRMDSIRGLLLPILAIALLATPPVNADVITYSSNQDSTDGVDDRGIFQIDPSAAPGTQPERLTPAPGVAHLPSWSPDGEAMVLQSEATAQLQIFENGIMSPIPDFLYAPVRPLTGTDAVWGPTGDTIAFASRRDGPSDLWLVQSDGSNLTRLTSFLGFAGRPSWSPQGDRLVFESIARAGKSDLYIIDAVQSEPVEPVDVEPIVETDEEEHSPSWSPDGSKIAYSRGSFGNEEIYVLDFANPSEPTPLTGSSGSNTAPKWSLDGSQIAFATTRQDESNPEGDIEVYIMDSDGRNQRNLTNNLALDDEPSWRRQGIIRLDPREQEPEVMQPTGTDRGSNPNPRDGTEKPRGSATAACNRAKLKSLNRQLKRARKRHNRKKIRRLKAKIRRCKTML